MIDPWEDVRELLYRYEDALVVTGTESAGRRILADADALLAVVRAAHEHRSYERAVYVRLIAGEDVLSDDELEKKSTLVDALDMALGALPKHLRDG
jgi:chloramphenicol 3-O-phosphotransferase